MTQEQMPEKIWACSPYYEGEGFYFDKKCNESTPYVCADICERNARIAEVAEEARVYCEHLLPVLRGELQGIVYLEALNGKERTEDLAHDKKKHIERVEKLHAKLKAAMEESK